MSTTHPSGSNIIKTLKFGELQYRFLTLEIFEMTLPIDYSSSKKKALCFIAKMKICIRNDYYIIIILYNYYNLIIMYGNISISILYNLY